MARPEVARQLDRTRHVYARRAAQAQTFVLQKIEQDRYRLLVRYDVGLLDGKVLDDRRDAAKPDAFCDGAALRRLRLPVREQVVHGRAPRIGGSDHDVRVRSRKAAETPASVPPVPTAQMKPFTRPCV